MNLLQKLREKLAKVAMAGVMLASTIAPAACTNTPVNPTPGDDPTKEDPIATHSQLLYDILNSSYYSKIVDNMNGGLNLNFPSQLADPIPYGFLEQEGYSIEEIKNNNINCESMVYTKDGEKNVVYISTRVENNAKTPYYTCYTLKYELTNLEYSDFYRIHNSKCIEAPLFIQEMSYKKEAVIESKASITIAAYDGILGVFKKYDDLSTDLFGNKNLTMDFLEFSVENQTLECIIRPDYTASGNFIRDSLQMRYAKLTSGNIIEPIDSIYSGMVYVRPKTAVCFGDEIDLEVYKSEPITVTYFDSQYKTNYGFGLKNSINNEKKL